MIIDGDNEDYENYDDYMYSKQKLMWKYDKEAFVVWAHIVGFVLSYPFFWDYTPFYYVMWRNKTRPKKAIEVFTIKKLRKNPRYMPLKFAIIDHTLLKLVFFNKK